MHQSFWYWEKDIAASLVPLLPRCFGNWSVYKDKIQKPPVQTSAPAAARFRRWFGCPPLCQRAGLVLPQLRVPAPPDSLKSSHFSDRTPPLASGTGAPLTRTHSQRALGVWRRGQNSSYIFMGETQIQQNPAGDGTEPSHTRSPKKVNESSQVTRILAPPPHAKRPSRVSPCQKSAIQCPTPKVV